MMFMRNETAFNDSDMVTFPSADLHGKTEARPMLNYGMLAGNLVETDQGWEPAEALAPGAKLVTTEGETQTLTRVEHSFARTASDIGLIHIQGGIFPGVSDLVLLPDQLVMLTSALAEARFGSPDVLVPAAALDVTAGVEIGSGDTQVQITSFGFEDEEVIFVSGDMRLLCPKAGTNALLTDTPKSEFWTVLDIEEARGLTSDLYARPTDTALLVA